jgi:hypothetical protein
VLNAALLIVLELMAASDSSDDEDGTYKPPQRRAASLDSDINMVVPELYADGFEIVPSPVQVFFSFEIG